jgi:hypothetical protein
MKDERPFYWTKPYDTGCAPSGWYQWTKRGLIYLGESILDDDRGAVPEQGMERA